jgi:hypothetical protein
MRRPSVGHGFLQPFDGGAGAAAAEVEAGAEVEAEAEVEVDGLIDSTAEDVVGFVAAPDDDAEAAVVLDFTGAGTSAGLLLVALGLAAA